MIHNRSKNGCLCCGHKQLTAEPAVVSGFLAARAWGLPPFLTQLFCCSQCGFRFFEHGLTESDANQYYAGYRDDDYLMDRRRWEFWYSRKQHEAIVAWSEAPIRREALEAILAKLPLPQPLPIVLDHGGDRGQMLTGLAATKKLVLDPSQVAPLEGVTTIRSASELVEEPSLILSCQVAEHVADPVGYLVELKDMLQSNGFLYVEVPVERWKGGATNKKFSTALLQSLLRFPVLLQVFDGLSTVARIKLGRIPPFGFMSMREHINYFTPSALKAAFSRAGMKVVASGVNRAGQLYAVATPQTELKKKSKDNL